MPYGFQGEDQYGEPYSAPQDELVGWACDPDTNAVAWVAGGRRPVAAAGPNAFDFTIKWANQGWYDGGYVTIRMNVHVRPTAANPNHYIWGGMWFQDVVGCKINLNTEPGVNPAALHGIVAQILANGGFGQIANGTAHF